MDEVVELSAKEMSSENKSYFKTFWDHRWLTFSLAYAELQQTVIRYPLSYLWWLLEPILLLCCYVFLVTVLGRGGARGGVPFFLFVFIGILPWHWTTKSVSGGINLIAQYSGPITQITFPKLTLIVARYFHVTILFIIGNSITITLLFIFGFWPNINWLYWPFLLFLHSILLFALMLYFSAQAVSMPDLAKFMPFILRIWFFGTPILYDIDMAKSHIPQKVLLAIKLNPLAYLSVSYRDILLHNKAPDMHAYVVWLVVLMLMLAICLFYFIRRERYFARYL